VIWSLFLQNLGADLTLIGLTFTMFALPVLVLSPLAGKLVDRRGSLGFIVAGMILPAVAALSYTLIRDPALAVPLILLEGTGFAVLNPSVYAVVAANSPPGRSSTSQGLFGAAGTLGFIVAAVTTGVLAERSLLLPFFTFAGVMVITLVLALAVGGSRLRGNVSDPVPAPATAT
jgi:DHA1 family multidrug resistance protein-like MFS transporter